MNESSEDVANLAGETESDLTGGPPLPNLEREYAPGEQLMTSDQLADWLRHSAGEHAYHARRMENPALRRLAAAAGAMTRHLAQMAEVPVDPVAVSTWVVVPTTPRFNYEGTRDSLRLTLTSGTRLTFRIIPILPVLKRLNDLLECARNEYLRDKGLVDPDLYRHADAAPGEPGISNATVTLGPDTSMNYEVDPIHDIVHLYFGSWDNPNNSALRLDIREPGPTLGIWLVILNQITSAYHLLGLDQHHFSGPESLD